MINDINHYFSGERSFTSQVDRQNKSPVQRPDRSTGKIKARFNAKTGEPLSQKLDSTPKQVNRHPQQQKARFGGQTGESSQNQQDSMDRTGKPLFSNIAPAGSKPR